MYIYDDWLNLTVQTHSFHKRDFTPSLIYQPFQTYIKANCYCQIQVYKFEIKVDQN